jgi:hypothetical protein
MTSKRAITWRRGEWSIKEGSFSIAENGLASARSSRLPPDARGKGVINMKTTNKTGKVVAILSVKEDSELIIVSQNGKIIRMESSTIRQAGRSTSGVKLVTLEEDDKVAAASVIPGRRAENGNGQDTADTVELLQLEFSGCD